MPMEIADVRCGILTSNSGRRVNVMQLDEAKFAEPRQEAAFFYGLFLRGQPLQKLRADIDVPPHVLERWKRQAHHDPTSKTMVERVLSYRKHVLAIFDSLVFREMVTPYRTQ